MKTDLSNAVDPLSRGSEGQLQPSQANTNDPLMQPPFGRALRAGIIFCTAAAIAFIGEFILALQNGAVQMFIVAGIGGALTVVGLISIGQIRRGRDQVGIKLLIGALLLTVLITPTLIAGFGLILGLGMILVTLTIASQTLSQRDATGALMLAVGVAIIAGGIDLLAPATQLSLPQFQTFILILGTVLILIYISPMVRQFGAYPLTIKLILAFLVVSLVPLGILSFVHDRNMRILLTDSARQPLLTAASQTADDIDSFMKTNLDSIKTEAQLPAFVAYLRLPPELRANSPQRGLVAATLQELSQKDRVFITSYALLDSEGLNQVDTASVNVQQNEADQVYFQKAVETGLPYVSTIQFNTSEADHAQTAQAGLFFSSAIRDPITDETIGVLRVQYIINILQQLIVQNNGLIGPDSFPILFDENQIRLAHGYDPTLVLKAVVPLEPNQVQTLQAEGRLPSEAHVMEVDPVVSLPDLSDGLDNAILEPYFTTQLTPTADRLNFIATQPLETQPWLVAYAQSQQRFLEPISVQTRTALFLAIGIAGAVAAVAFMMGRFLANPLVHLTGVVTRFTEGDLGARATVKSADESGLLAQSFNIMAQQVGNLVSNLADRTMALEKEVSERRQVEKDLQTSERKYRAIFEDSKDVILITAPSGQIVDINPAGVQFSGYSMEEFKTLNVEALYANPQDRKAFLKAMEADGSVKDFEIQLQRKDGTKVDSLITAGFRYTPDGTFLGYQGIVRDITAQKRREQERIQLLAIQRELSIAQQIQESLLPPSRPTWQGPELICYSSPARRVGGDFYTYYAFDDRYCFAVGDISGKGMPAALLMSVSLASLQSIIPQGLQPRDLLTTVDQAIVPYTRTIRENCALVYAEVRPPETSNEVGQLVVANAGCIPPLVRRTNGSVTWADATGLPLGLGLSGEHDYAIADMPLFKGDQIVMASDGIIEAINEAGEMFGFEKFEATVAAGPEDAVSMLAYLKNEATTFLDSIEPRDDMTIVVVQV